MQRHIEDFLRFLEDERRLSGHTIAAYRRDLSDFHRHSVRHLRRAPRLSDLDRTLVRDFMRMRIADGPRRGQLYAPRAAARRLAAVRSFCAYLVRHELLTENVAKEIRAPKIGKPLPRVLPDTALTDALARLDDGTPRGKRDRAVLELLYGTGIRL